MEKEEIVKNIFLLRFDDREEQAKIFLRFQEHYESPEFRGKVFTLEEYKDWYTKLKGKFSYYTDWIGFNFPSYVFSAFKEGKFDPLSEKEKELLKLFENITDPFYVISIWNDKSDKSKNKIGHTLRHEIAHGFFYTKPDYRKRVQEILSRYDLSQLKEWLRGRGGYHEDVLEDECHAYALTGSSKLAVEIPDKLKEEIQALFEEAMTGYNQGITI